MDRRYGGIFHRGREELAGYNSSELKSPLDRFQGAFSLNWGENPPWRDALKITKNGRSDFVFVLTPESLLELDGHIREYVQTERVNYYVRCADNAKRDFDNVGQLIAYDNAKSRRITYITIHSAKDKRDVFMTMGNTLVFQSMSVQVEGLGEDEEKVFRVLEKLETTFEGMTPWYKWITKTSFPFLVMVFSAAVVLIGFGIIIVRGEAHKISWDNTFALPAVLAGMMIALMGISVETVKNYFFPKIDFALGQGAQRHKNMEVVRMGVIIAFFINIVSGLLLIFW